MRKELLTRTWTLAVAFAMIGLVVGVVAGFVYNSREHRVKAQATLAMLPSPEIPLLETPKYWDILTMGQATRSAAIVLGDQRWLDSAAVAAGVPRSELTLTAGALPETTLITVSVQADSPATAERVLEWVLEKATPLAGSIAGPFSIQVISPPRGTARPTGPAQLQVVVALALGGVVVGIGAGLILGRPARKRLALRERESPASQDRTIRESLISRPAERQALDQRTGQSLRP